MASPVNVGPDVAKPTHHLALVDINGQTVGLIAVNAKNQPDDTVIGRNPVDRSSLKTSTGQSSYSDLRPPYNTIVQQDWSGGRAASKFENDATKFKDSLRVNTSRAAKVILQGREVYTAGFRTDRHLLPGSMKMVALINKRIHLAKYAPVNTAIPTFSATQIWAWVRYIGKPNGDLTVNLRASPTSLPGTILKTITLAVTDIPGLVSELHKFLFTSYSITSGTGYFIEFVGSTGDDEENHWEVGASEVAGETYQSPDGSTNWVLDSCNIYYRLIFTPADGDGIFFDYGYSKYFVTRPADGSAAKLWINGVKGTATSNSGDKTKLNAAGSPGWTVNELAGGIVVIPSGAGSTEAQNYRTIVSNTINTITVDTPWLITHDTTTCFVVVGIPVDKWTEITGTGLAKPVTCVLVSSQNVVYFCQGEGTTKIRRMREYNNSGTFTREYADDVGSALFLVEYNENGIMNILACNNGNQVCKNKVTKTMAGTVAIGTMVITDIPDTTWLKAGMKMEGVGVGVGSVIYTVDTGSQVTGTVNNTDDGSTSIKFTWGTPPWGSNLVWEPVMYAGDVGQKITNLVRYVNDSQDEAIWVMKEDGSWIWVGGALDSLDRSKLEEFSTVASAKNGRVAVRQGVYLWYTVQNSIHRFYHPTLEDLGPTLDEGMPSGRQGPIVSAVAYPGRLFVAIDAGATGYSSVMENNGGSSWHEIYRAPYGERIFGISFQVIPGSTPDRLWIRQSNDMVFMPFPSDTFDPYQDSTYHFTHEGILTLASMYAGLIDAWKNWHAIKTHAENLIEDKTWLEADYRLDDEEDWHTFPDIFEEIPISTVPFGNKFGASSKKADLRIRLYSTDQTKTPKLLAVIVEAVAVAAPKFALTFGVLVSVKDLQGHSEDLLPFERIKILDEWSGKAQPLLLSSNNPLYDGMHVFLQPLPTKPTAVNQRVQESDYITSIIIQES